MPTTRRRTIPWCGAPTGLALLLALPVAADEAFRDQVHAAHRHQSYLLVESAAGATLYLFNDDAASPAREPEAFSSAESTGPIDSALARTRSSYARDRVLALTELAGAADPEALRIAVLLLDDPVAAVRNEARQLILDHPDGAATAVAYGIEDPDDESTD